MNRRVLGCWIVFTVMAMAVSMMAQTPSASNRAAIEKQIVANERAINEAIAKGDMKTFHANLAPDAVGVDSGGVTRVNAPNFDEMMKASKIQSWDIDGSQFYWVNDNAVVHMYRWTGKGTYQGQPIPSSVWASTLWTNNSGKWVAVFHQETTGMTAPTQLDTKPGGNKKR